jgi:hypothetical protein
MSEPIIDRWTPVLDAAFNTRIIPRLEALMAERFGPDWDSIDPLPTVVDEFLQEVMVSLRVMIECITADTIDKLIDARRTHYRALTPETRHPRSSLNEPRP